METLPVGREGQDTTGRDAVEKVEGNAGSPVPDELVSQLLAAPDAAAFLEIVLAVYRKTLSVTPEALAHVKSRGVSAEAIEKFQLGFSDRTLGLKIPDIQIKAGRQIRERLQNVGLYRATGREHMVGAVVFPIRDGKGCVREMYGRKNHGHLRAGTAFHLFLAENLHLVWNIEALASREVIVCAGIYDALALWCRGYRHVTATFGNRNLSTLIPALKSHGVKKVFIAYRISESGERDGGIIATETIAAGIETLKVMIPDGLDMNEYLTEKNPSADDLKILFNTAMWLGKGTRPTANTENNPASLTDAPSSEILTPTLSAPPIPTEVKGDEVHVTLGNRHYRIRGLFSNSSFSVLKVNIRVNWGENYHVDSLDLYASRPREAFLRAASEELGIEAKILQKDLGKVLLKLEELQEQRIRQTMKVGNETPAMTEHERTEALDFLKKENLLDAIAGDFDSLGIVGERTNALVGYLAAVSRKLPDPLAIVFQSSSSSGKSTLMEGILKFVPPEDKMRFSAITGRSLFYVGEQDLSHKSVAFAEEEGMEQAGYSVKVLQSEKELSIASTGKDDDGRLVTMVYTVKGPVQFLFTTTNIDIHEELENRCLLLSINETREQTRSILERQRERETMEGMMRRNEEEAICGLHHNAQRLLRPLLVINPYAKRLTFLDTRLRMRRDHVKYLCLIRAIALLKQFQRPVKQFSHGGKTVEYIEVEVGDIALANTLAGEVLGRSLDELTPQTKRLLELVKEMVAEACRKHSIAPTEYRFTRRDIRNHTGWTDYQVRAHMKKLVDLEYVVRHCGQQGQVFVYELLYNGGGEAGNRFMMGLADAETLPKRGNP